MGPRHLFLGFFLWIVCGGCGQNEDEPLSQGGGATKSPVPSQSAFSDARGQPSQNAFDSMLKDMARLGEPNLRRVGFGSPYREGKVIVMRLTLQPPGSNRKSIAELHEAHHRLPGRVRADRSEDATTLVLSVKRPSSSDESALKLPDHYIWDLKRQALYILPVEEGLDLVERIVGLPVGPPAVKSTPLRRDRKKRSVLFSVDTSDREGEEEEEEEAEKKTK